MQLAPPSGRQPHRAAVHASSRPGRAGRLRTTRGSRAQRAACVAQLSARQLEPHAALAVAVTPAVGCRASARAIACRERRHRWGCPATSRAGAPPAERVGRLRSEQAPGRALHAWVLSPFRLHCASCHSLRRLPPTGAAGRLAGGAAAGAVPVVSHTAGPCRRPQALAALPRVPTAAAVPGAAVCQGEQRFKGAAWRSPKTGCSR